MDKFEINEVAILARAADPYFKNVIGMEVTIVDIEHGHGAPYKTDFIDDEGDHIWAYEHNLRKKRPPTTNQDIEESKEHGTGDWDLMPFKPEILKEKEKA